MISRLLIPIVTLTTNNLLSTVVIVCESIDLLHLHPFAFFSAARLVFSFKKSMQLVGIREEARRWVLEIRRIHYKWFFSNWLESLRCRYGISLIKSPLVELNFFPNAGPAWANPFEKFIFSWLSMPRSNRGFQDNFNCWASGARCGTHRNCFGCFVDIWALSHNKLISFYSHRNWKLLI